VTVALIYARYCTKAMGIDEQELWYLKKSRYFSNQRTLNTFGKIFKILLLPITVQ
jgi:hypothetical protein